MKLDISVGVHVRQLCLVYGNDKLILFRQCKDLKDYHCLEMWITHTHTHTHTHIYIYIYIYIYICVCVCVCMAQIIE